MEFKVKHNLKFDDIAIPNPTFDEIAKDYEELVAALDSAHDTNSRIAIVRKWDQLSRQVYTWYYYIELKFVQNTSDENAKANLQYRDELWPKVIELEISIKRKFLQEPFRNDIEAKFNKHIIALWEAEILTYEPVIKEDLISESKLKNKYNELRSGAELQFKGKTYCISKIQKFFQDLDRNVRHEALKVMWNWFTENGDQFDSIFDELVKRRTNMAQKLGFNSYIELAYKSLKRVGYNQAEVEKYRQEVLEYVVPLTQRLMEKQRVRLRLEKLYVYDAGLFSLEGNPNPQGDHDFIVARAIEMFDDLGVELGDCFRMMKNNHLFDLEARQNKGHAGCYYLPDYGIPYIFSSFNGTMNDIEVFVHEMGHAFQYYSSCHQQLLDYQAPTWDSCEIHSMTLEFLTYPFMEKFFGDKGAKQYRQIHLEKSLLFLPYGVAVDHFQHLVYANPQATPAERHVMWKEMEKLYLPGWDWGDIAYPSKGGRWQLTPHIFLHPLYYVDYTLAQCCAMQFWLKSEENFSKAMNDYTMLCKRGGEASFPNLIKSAGLSSPFEAGCLAKVVTHACEFLE